MSRKQSRKQSRRQSRIAVSALISAAFLILSAVLFSSSPAVALEEDYGVAAWAYLQEIDRSYPSRISDARYSDNTTQRDACGAWIRQLLTDFGYTVETIEWDRTEDGHTNHIVSYVARKKGESTRTITVGAHYDSVGTDGVEDNGTGVALVLELAKRFAGEKDLPYTIDFCFWDGEETQIYAGSSSYVLAYPYRGEIICYLNLDCIGAGDRMYAYGGVYNDKGELTLADGLNAAFYVAEKNGISLNKLPEAVTRYKTPTRDGQSDQHYFVIKNIPYVYFEANAWVKPDGTVGNAEKPYMYNSSLACFAETNGQIIHTKFDDLATLETLVPGRIQSHLHDFSILSTKWILRMFELEKDKEAAAKETTASSSKAEETRASSSSAEGTDTVSSKTEETAITTTEEEETAETSTEEEETAANPTESEKTTEASTETEKTSAPSSTAPGPDTGSDDEPKGSLFLPIFLVSLAGALLIGIRAVIYIRRTSLYRRKQKKLKRLKKQRRNR